MSQGSDLVFEVLVFEFEVASLLDLPGLFVVKDEEGAYLVVRSGLFGGFVALEPDQVPFVETPLPLLVSLGGQVPGILVLRVVEDEEESVKLHFANGLLVDAAGDWDDRVRAGVESLLLYIGGA